MYYAFSEEKYSTVMYIETLYFKWLYFFLPIFIYLS